MRQKIRQSTNEDPRIPKEIVRKIESYLLNHPDTMGALLFRVGYQAIKEAIKNLRLNSNQSLIY